MNQLAVIEQPSVPAFSYHDIERIAAAFAQSRMFGVSDPAAALSLCLLAQAEGQHPAIAFRDYSIIQGRPAKKAEAMQRDFLASGGKIKWIKLDDTCAEAEFSHPSGGTAIIDWTIDRAKAAGLGGKDMWRKYPRQMLRSRVISEGVRTVCPMATSGMYVPEEVADFGPDERAPVTAVEFVEAKPEPVKGITKIKARLREMRTAGDSPDMTLEGFRKLKRDNRDDLRAIRDANHSWWTGDGEDFEGYEAWMERRIAELSEPDGKFAMLIESMKQCETVMSLTNWMAANEAIIEELDGAESRKFQTAYELHESSIREMDKVHS